MRIEFATLDLKTIAATTSDRISFGDFPRSPTHPFALRLGITQSTVVLALVGVYYANTDFEYETFFRTPDTCPGTFSSGWGC